ncbi:hypothetical protein [Streptomyces shenzhenensis]|uniref:hypothetical protein n=1 Tax=Streptomyces shenzhenensis TaxID=943815 RepID=UPI001F1B9EC1|nr:hypothetical protein [Streptomyces shenzhenensis]
MAGRGRAWGSGAVGLCLLLLPLAGCGGGQSSTGAAMSAVQQVLDRRAAAVLAHDEKAYAGTGTRGPYANLRAVPLADWSYRLTALHPDGAGATADARLSYRIRGYDRAPVTTDRTLTLSRTADGHWYVTYDKPAGKSGQQLWDQGRVTAVKSTHSLVLGVGQSLATLRGYARLADTAVPGVTKAWGTDWTRRVVLLVPGSLNGMAALLGAPASNYRGIAAVTTGEAGGQGQAPADRVVLNPEAYAVLGPVGRQVVLTHETTHVATRAHTTPATPLWLSEGYADWIGYLGTGRTPTEVAPELARAVQAGEAPGGLPADQDFGFTDDPTTLAKAYEGGWLACRMIAGHWGEGKLGAFYRAVGAHQGRAGAVEDALRTELGTTLPDFTARWRDYVAAQLGDG